MEGILDLIMHMAFADMEQDLACIAKMSRRLASEEVESLSSDQAKLAFLRYIC